MRRWKRNGPDWEIGSQAIFSRRRRRPGGFVAWHIDGWEVAAWGPGLAWVKVGRYKTEGAAKRCVERELARAEGGR